MIAPAGADSLQALEQKCCVVPAALLALTFLVFSPLIMGGQFFWDDAELLTDNRWVHAAGGLWQIWFSRESPDYYPVMSSTFWLEWRLWHLWAPGYHLTNVLLHWGSAVLLWRVLRQLAVPGALLAAAVFAVHPVTVESVAWIAERKNTLSLVFMLAAALMYLRADVERLDWRNYAAALVLFLLALLSKTAVVMLPVVLLILAWYRHGRVRWRDVVRLLPFLALSAALGLVTIYFQYFRAIGGVPIRNDSFASLLAGAGWAVWFYLGKALVPANLCFNYPRWNNILGIGAAAFLPLAVLAILAAWLWIRRASAARHALVGLASYVVLLLPMLGFLNIFFMRYSLVSDHWQYHALPCVVALVCGVAVGLMRRSGPRYERAWFLAGGGVILALAAYSVRLAGVYCSADSIWRHTIACNPNAWLPHANLGLMHFAEAQRTHDPNLLAVATEHFAQALAIEPNVDNAVNLANAYLVSGRAPDAVAILERALAVPSADPSVQARGEYALASALAASGHADLAPGHLWRAVELDPNFAAPRRALAKMSPASATAPASSPALPAP